jgi:hypothetical protein
MRYRVVPSIAGLSQYGTDPVGQKATHHSRIGN